MRGAGPFSAPPWGLLPAAVTLAAFAVTGCTMCPDPYDYSGPVPNGSPPQNDFRARSNGILPIGGSPHPWPTIVKSSPGTPHGRSRPGSIAKGEVKQLSAEKPVASPESTTVDEPTGTAGDDTGNALPVSTRATVAVIGEVDEEESNPADEEIAAADPAAETVTADGDEADSDTEASSPVPEPLPVPPLPDTIDEAPVSEEPPVADTPASQAEPDVPAAEQPSTKAATTESAAAGTPPPGTVLRETPGWRPRRSLNPALYGR